MESLKALSLELKPIKEAYAWLTKTNNLLIKIPVIGAGLVYILTHLAKFVGVNLSTLN